MSKKLTSEQIKKLLDDAVASFPHEDCYTCECFLGFIAQLGLDIEKVQRPLLSKYKPDRNLVHSCMGCDPCPPANIYANYMQSNRLIGTDQIK